MTNYDFLQTIVNRFPSLMGLDCEVYPSKVKVVITDAQGNTILSKEVTIEGVFEKEEEVDHLKNGCAFDLISHLCLLAHGNIKAQIVKSQEKTKSQLN